MESVIFKKYDRVIMTQHAIDDYINTGNSRYPPTVKGTIIRIRNDGLIVVNRDERIGDNIYHPSFWKPLTPKPICRVCKEP